MAKYIKSSRNNYWFGMPGFYKDGYESIEFMGLVYDEWDILEPYTDMFEEDFGISDWTDDEDKFVEYVKDHQDIIEFDLEMYRPIRISEWVIDEISDANGIDDLSSILTGYKKSTYIPDGLIDEFLAEIKSFKSEYTKQLQECKNKLVEVVPTVNENRYDDDDWVIGEISKSNSFKQLYQAIYPFDTDLWEVCTEIIDDYRHDFVNNQGGSIKSNIISQLKDISNWAEKYLVI